MEGQQKKKKLFEEFVALPYRATAQAWNLTLKGFYYNAILRVDRGDRKVH